MMAYHGPSYGLSRECQMKSQAKFDPARAKRVCEWIEAVTGTNLDLPSNEEGISDQLDFGHALKDGIAICQLLNALQPGLVKKVNTMKAPFKQRENIEMFLKGCEAYGLKSQDLFQVNDLYENKNLYMVVDCIYALGGMIARIAEAQKHISEDSHKIIGLQSGSNKGASQAGMTPYGATRQIMPDGEAPSYAPIWSKKQA
ncbi:calponin-3 [Hyalella azteca]|uniref:Transgelin n=1 Tax=Hyalella azteca TaxID=294128 RepID=A0A979FNC5_HYAAZ|nr:calponin-3 [Hyalella azteca]